MVVNAQSEAVMYPRYVCSSPCGAGGGMWAGCCSSLGSMCGARAATCQQRPRHGSTDSWCDPAGTGLPRALQRGLVLPLSTGVLVKLPLVPGCYTLSSCRLSSSRGQSLSWPLALTHGWGCHSWGRGFVHLITTSCLKPCRLCSPQP